ncbi:MAG: succinate dehydrogenase cytochrome b subunit [Rhodopirellula sp.]|nr:succinate dehydrogenase cytochrome b subunit [Rhodopirellula sp.]
MAMTGLALCGFLVVHLAGNLLLFAGAEAYNAYAHKLHDNEDLLHVAETGLALIFLVHLFLAFKLSAENRIARGRGYAENQTKRQNLIINVRPELWMLLTGLGLLSYMILHLADFTLELRDLSHYEGLEPFDKAVSLLHDPISIVGYLVGFAFLFAHLSHGISSAFQSLGLNHPKYNACIKWGGLAFAGALALGNMSLVVWAMGQ